MALPLAWPRGKRFAFTIFDDPDAQSLANSETVYSLLAELGIFTTKSVWMMEPPVRNSGGETCENEAYLRHVLDLQRQGFEIGYHNGAPGDLDRSAVIRSLDLFRSAFGHDPVTMANHYNADAMYWGKLRLTGLPRFVYTMATRGGNSNFYGAIEGHPSYWGDVCRQRIQYCRNFVVREINTLKACPFMPYFDPAKPLVQAWYASSEGANCHSFIQTIAEAEQDRLEEEGGACIMYAHFGHHFLDEQGRLRPDFVRLMKRLAQRSGWFVPTGTLLNFLRAQQGLHQVTPYERQRIEWSWLLAKLRHGTS